MLGSLGSLVNRAVERVRGARQSPRLLLLRMFPSVGKGLTAILVALVIAAPVLTLTLTIAGGVLIGSAPGAIREGFDSPDGRRLTASLLVMGGALILQYATSGIRDALAFIAGRRFNRILRTRVLDATLSPPGVAHVEDPEFLDKISITGAGFDMDGATPGAAASGAVQVAVNRLEVIPPVLLLGAFRWWLPLVMGAGQLWLRRAMGIHIRSAVATRISESPVLRRAQYYVDLAVTPGAAKETRVFGLSTWLSDRFRSHYLEAMAAIWRTRAANRRKLYLPIVGMGLSTGFAYLVIVGAAVDGVISLTALAILLRAASGMRMLLAFSNEDINLQHGSAVLPTILEVEQRMTERREAITGTLPAAGLPQQAVRFENVCFRYPGSTHEVYAGLDLEIRAGESLAVVGVNGAGKTTLVKLLARLHDPVGGRITVDGTDLREIDPVQWQRRVAAIFQDFTHYELSARDNVGFGAFDLAHEDEALGRAVEQAGAADIVASLPNGWDTVLSRRFTDGTDLSGGQWQRIALARALLAVQGGAGILVLDEPTANLDVRAEAELYDRFLDFTRGVTTVVISHRFSTVRRADRIVVLDGGRVVEDGTHDELIALNGRYARMFLLQAARFREDADVQAS